MKTLSHTIEMPPTLAKHKSVYETNRNSELLCDPFDRMDKIYE